MFGLNNTGSDTSVMGNAGDTDASFMNSGSDHFGFSKRAARIRGLL